MSKIITPQQDEAQKRLEEFRKEYAKLVEKYHIDISATVQPQLRFIDLNTEKEK